MISFGVMLFASLALAAEPLPLWSDKAPGSIENPGEKVVKTNDAGERTVTQVHRPTITPFLPPADKATGAAMIIAPGGGHRMLCVDHEGCFPAQFFAERGIACFVLEYRLAREEGSHYRIQEEATSDMRRAIRTVRAHAEEWKVRPDRIGVIGFSAGGELVANCGMESDSGTANAEDAIERQSSRPDFLGLIYPGRSDQIQPAEKMAPVFIACGYGDRKDISEGMAETYLRLKRAGIPTELHIYSNAAHGFGVRTTTKGAVAHWPDRLVDWLTDRGLMKAAN
jgi:endo-1,4-beta-xylanase